LEHAFGTNRSSATVAEGGTHDELRFKWVAHDGRRVGNLWRTGLGKRRPCQILVIRWQQHNQSLMSDLKSAPVLLWIRHWQGDMKSYSGRLSKDNGPIAEFQSI